MRQEQNYHPTPGRASFSVLVNGRSLRLCGTWEEIMAMLHDLCPQGRMTELAAAVGDGPRPACA